MSIPQFLILLLILTLALGAGLLIMRLFITLMLGFIAMATGISPIRPSAPIRPGVCFPAGSKCIEAGCIERAWVNGVCRGHWFQQSIIKRAARRAEQLSTHQKELA